MAVNDLMMKIQLLVESGKSSAELKRLQQALKALQTQLTALDRTQLTPLTRDLNAVKQAASNLKTVNLGNFAAQIDEVKKSFTGLGLATTSLDQLKTAYQKLNTQLASGDLQRYQVQLKAVSDRLREAKSLTLTNQFQTKNTAYEKLNRDLGQYNSLILSATKSIVAQQQAILGLKNQLSQLPKIKIDPTIGATLKELVKNGQGKVIRVDDLQKSFASMQDFNTELAKQQGLYNQSRLNAQKYQETLAKLRIEGQRLAIPDLTIGGTRNLIRELEQAKTKVSDLSQNGIIPLQNEIRKLQARSSFNKAFNIDPLKASVKVARAELAQLSLDAQKTRALGGTVGVADESRMAALKQQIVDSNKKIADLELKAQQTTARGIAHANQRLAIKQNELAIDKASFQNIQSLIASQKQAAQLASQSVKTRTGGTFDIAAAKAAAQAEANLYKNNLASLKQYLSTRKTAATEEANLLKQQIQGVQQRLAQQQLTKAEWSAERAEIRANIAAEKARSQVYQQTLRDQQRSVKEAIQSEKERERSLKTQIRTLTQLGTAQAQVKAIQLQSELASAKTRQGDLKSQVRDIEQAAKAEIQRIRTLEQSSNALRRQGNSISTLGRLFKEAGGPVREFSAALKFALGPQMAGFAAAGSIIGLMSGFVTANKEIENLKRGLNAITGSSELYFQELTNTANRLGQSILVVSDSYLQLVAASKGTRLEGEATRQIFEAVSNALVLTGADAVRSRRAFLALAQMMSKGQIYAEELRQQLSEALPGAVNIFSRALGVAPQKLLEMMKAGEVSSDALILFMGELKKSMPPVTQEMFTFSQKAALLQNTFQRLFVEVGDTGVWNALGDSLVSANRFLSKATDGVGDLGDEVKTTFGYLSTLGALTGIGEALSGGLEGLVDFSKKVFDEFVSILDGLPAKAAEIAIRTRAALQQASTATGGESGAFTRILGEVGAFNESIKSVYQSIFSGDFGAAAIDNLSRSFDSFVSGGIESSLRNAQAELLRLQQTARLTKEQFDALGSFERPGGMASAPLKINLGDYAAYNRFVDESIAKEQQNIQGLEKKRSVIQQITQERKADLSAVDEAGQTRDYLNLFNEGYRTAIKSAREAIAATQRAAELSAKVATVQDKQAANKIQAIKKIQDLENSIYETQVRSKEITDAAVKNRLEDERSLLELTLDRANALAQSEENAKNLRKGREDQGIYFTDDMKKASRDAQQARKLEQQAIELSERAAQSKNEVEKRGLLENSKYLQEQAAQLNQSAGETYRLKQNYEALAAIAQQLTKAGEAELKIRQDIAEAERLAEQARNAQSKATDPQALKAERDEWSRIADERARAAAQKFSDAGLTEQAAAMGQLRLELENIQQIGKTELENKIVAALKQFNLQNQPDYQQVFADLGKQLNELRKAESDIVGQLQKTQSPEAKATLEDRLAQIRRDFQVLNQAYQRVREQLQQAINAGEAPGIEFPSYLESKGAIDAVPGALSTTQGVVNQSAPIVFRSVLQAPSLNSAPEQSVPIALGFTQNPASQIINEWQQTLQQLPTPGFLTCPVEVDTTSLIPAATQTLSDVQQLFGDTKFAFDTTQPIQSLDQLKYAFVSTQAQIVSASQTAQQNPITYTIKAANPQEQQTIEDRVAFLKQNPNLTVNLNWVTTGGETVDGFTKGLEKQAVVSITAKSDPAQAASEGAKLGQVAATAANQVVAQNPLNLKVDLRGLDGSNFNNSIQLAMDQAKATVKTSVAQMNQELLTQLGQREDGFQIKIQTVVDQTSLEGWKRQVQLLSAQDHRVSLRADTAELDQEFRRIDGKLAEWNRTAGDGLEAGFVSASAQAKNFGLLVDQVNQKMRAIQQSGQAINTAPIQPTMVLKPETTKQLHDDVQSKLAPIQVSADAQGLIGPIQDELLKLQQSGATAIKVTVDQNTGKLIVTVDTSQATSDVSALIASIQSNPVVQTVNVVFNVPTLNLPDKTQYVNVVYRNSGSSSSSSGGESKNRWGGYISGYGGGDRIRALLEPGEFVLRKEVVKALGLSSLTKLNNMGFNAKIPKPTPPMIDRVSIPRFSNGGAVQGQPIVINIPGGKSIQVSGSRDSAMQLANLLTRVGRAL